MQCLLCPRFCVIREGDSGNCAARRNKNGVLYSEVWGKIAAFNVDPVEKKPLYHFAPGSRTLSIATVGCNLHCKFCQNWELSQAKEVYGKNFTPLEVVLRAKKERAQGISYTYTEPTVFYEFAYDTARLAKKAGLYNVLVTNGYINPEPLRRIAPLIDAANVDLKAFTDAAYREYCGIQSMKPVLSAIWEMVGAGIHVELTNLIVPGMNDDAAQIKEMCEWICQLSPEIPLHFSRYHPEYLLRAPVTPLSTLLSAYSLAKRAGIKYVYLGNIADEKYSTTHCPACGEAVIERSGLEVVSFRLEDGRCPHCGKSVLMRGMEFLKNIHL